MKDGQCAILCAALFLAPHLTKTSAIAVAALWTVIAAIITLVVERK